MNSITKTHVYVSPNLLTQLPLSSQIYIYIYIKCLAIACYSHMANTHLTSYAYQWVSHRFFLLTAHKNIG
jgi:hypothetical protein